MWWWICRCSWWAATLFKGLHFVAFLPFSAPMSSSTCFSSSLIQTNCCCFCWSVFVLQFTCRLWSLFSSILPVLKWRVWWFLRLQAVGNSRGSSSSSNLNVLIHPKTTLLKRSMSIASRHHLPWSCKQWFLSNGQVDLIAPCDKEISMGHEYSFHLAYQSASLTYFKN